MSKKAYGTVNFWQNDNKYYCSINYKNHRFVGETNCYPEDKDFENESIGYTIAEMRAEIKRLSYEKEIAAAKLAALIHLREGSIVLPSSNLGKHLITEIAFYEERIRLIDESMNDIQKYIREYINGKDKLWNYLRERDEAKDN